MSAAAERIIEQLQARRVRNDEYRARCPAHQGQSRSSLAIKDTGSKVLLHCFKGCPLSDVLEALGMSAAELFDAVPHTTTNATRTGSGVRAVQGLTMWADGRLLQVCRLLRELESDLSRYALLLTEDNMDEPTAWLLSNVYKLRNDLEWEFHILNSRNLRAELELWRQCG